MKRVFLLTILVACCFVSLHVAAQPSTPGNPEHAPSEKHLFIDVHQLEAGKAKPSDIAKAHQKDLQVEGKYEVDILKYWFDEENGRVYCLAVAPDAAALIKTHTEAHGLVPTEVYPVTAGQEAALKGKKNLYLDVHYLGAGKVTAKDVAAAHLKDLAVQKKYGVNLINYWVDEKEGIVMCLAEAKNPNDLVKTHKEAHGLLPAQVMKVKQGK